MQAVDRRLDKGIDEDIALSSSCCCAVEYRLLVAKEGFGREEGREVNGTLGLPLPTDGRGMRAREA